MTYDQHRLGQFLLSEAFLEAIEPEMWAAFCSTFVPIYVEWDIEEDAYRYLATSKQFSELSSVAQVPTYEPDWNKEEGRYIWRHK